MQITYCASSLLQKLDICFPLIYSDPSPSPLWWDLICIYLACLGSTIAALLFHYYSIKMALEIPQVIWVWTRQDFLYPLSSFFPCYLQCWCVLGKIFKWMHLWARCLLTLCYLSSFKGLSIHSFFSFLIFFLIWCRFVFPADNTQFLLKGKCNISQILKLHQCTNNCMFSIV